MHPLARDVKIIHATIVMRASTQRQLQDFGEKGVYSKSLAIPRMLTSGFSGAWRKTVTWKTN